MMGVLFYVVGVLSTPETQMYSSSAFEIAALTLIGGLGALILGYGSVIIIGGMISLKMAELIARVTRSKHIIEIVDEEPKTSGFRITQDAFMLYVPALVFILALTLTWDIHNLHEPASMFHPLLHALDVFAKPVGTDPISYFVDVVLVMIVLIAIAGITPSVAIPYFRKFKITGVNSGPFHTNFLFMVIGLVAGLGALLTLVGHLYQVLWVGKGPTYYYYVIPVMLGLSLHYAVGAFLARDKSEDMVETRLEANSSERIIRGTVSIQGNTTANTKKPR